MAVYDSLNPPPTSPCIRRWAVAFENGQYDSALSILDEGLQTAAKKKNAAEVAEYTNLKEFTHDVMKILASHKEGQTVTKYCSMCGKGEPDGRILVAGAQCVICDECIRVCLRIVDTRSRELGKEIECSFCGKKASEVSKIIAGPGVGICNECCRICDEILGQR